MNSESGDDGAQELWIWSVRWFLEDLLDVSDVCSVGATGVVYLYISGSFPSGQSESLSSAY